VGRSSPRTSFQPIGMQQDTEDLHIFCAIAMSAGGCGKALGSSASTISRSRACRCTRQLTPACIFANASKVLKDNALAWPDECWERTSAFRFGVPVRGAHQKASQQQGSEARQEPRWSFNANGLTRQIVGLRTQAA